MGDLIPFPRRHPDAHPSGQGPWAVPGAQPGPYQSLAAEVAEMREAEDRMEALFDQFPDEEAHLVAAGLYFDESGLPRTTHVSG